MHTHTHTEQVRIFCPDDASQFFSHSFIVYSFITPSPSLSTVKLPPSAHSHNTHPSLHSSSSIIHPFCLPLPAHLSINSLVCLTRTHRIVVNQSLHLAPPSVLDRGSGGGAGWQGREIKKRANRSYRLLRCKCLWWCYCNTGACGTEWM